MSVDYGLYSGCLLWWDKFFWVFISLYMYPCCLYVGGYAIAIAVGCAGRVGGWLACPLTW